MRAVAIKRQLFRSGFAAVLAVTAFAVLAAPSFAQTACKKLTLSPEFDESAAVRLGRGNVETARTTVARTPSDTLAVLMPSLIGNVKGAREACAELVKKPSRKIMAYACVGDASAFLAQHEPNSGGWWDEAYCAYQSVHDLAAKDKTKSAAVNAMAWAGQAKLMASRDATRAAEAYREAIKLQKTPDWYVSLAEIEKTTGQRQAAYNTYVDLFANAGNNPAFGQAEKAKARMEQARLLQGGGVNASGGTTARQLWTEAATLLEAARLPGTAEAYFHIGMLDFKSADPKSSRASFTKAAGTATSTSDQAAYIAQSHYYLGLLDARDLQQSGSAWMGVAQHAEKAGAGVPGAARIACIAFIGNGDKVTFGLEADANRVCLGQPGAEGKLLEGLYYLRRAQFVPLVCATAQQTNCRGNINTARAEWLGHLGKAEEAFKARGLTIGEATIDWLEQGQGSAVPKLADMLRAGEDIADSAQSRQPTPGCNIPAPVAPADVTKFYATLDLLGCRPKGWQ